MIVVIIYYWQMKNSGDKVLIDSGGGAVLQNRGLSARDRGLSVADSAGWCSALTAERPLKAIPQRLLNDIGVRNRLSSFYVYLVYLNNGRISRSSGEHRLGLLPP